MPHLARSTAAPAAAHPAPSRRPDGPACGTLINLSGRRRFTSQRVVLYAVLAHQGQDGALALARAALDTFLQAHEALGLGGADLPGLFCGELQAAHHGPDGGEPTIRAFADVATRALQAIGEGRPGAQALVDALVAAATPLLAVLNRITQVYEDLAVRHARDARAQLGGVLGDIESIARHARIVAFNAQVAAARAGGVGREFAVVAGELTAITTRIDELVREALRASGR